MTLDQGHNVNVRGTRKNGQIKVVFLLGKSVVVGINSLHAIPMVNLFWQLLMEKIVPQHSKP